MARYIAEINTTLGSMPYWIGVADQAILRLSTL